MGMIEEVKEEGGGSGRRCRGDNSRASKWGTTSFFKFSFVSDFELILISFFSIFLSY